MAHLKKVHLFLPGLVAQSVTQAVARRSLDGIGCLGPVLPLVHTQKGDRSKAVRHPGPTKGPLSGM